MKSADLLGQQDLAEEVDGGHLTAEHRVFFHVLTRPEEALVKRLHNNAEIEEGRN